jgi:hypothetical protein
MKKFLVVLTILVLVAGFAFATVTGSVEARYTFDFSEGNPKTLKYGIYGTHSKLSFSVSTDKGGIDGSNKPYAVVAVDLELCTDSFDATTTAEELIYDGATYASYHYDLGTTPWWTLDVYLTLSDFRIVGENWEINFLKAIGVGDYAKSAWEVGGYKTDGVTKTKAALDMGWKFGAQEGITVTYDGYKVGVYAKRGDDLKLVANLRAESKELTLAEGVTGQAALAVGASKNGSADMSFDFGASFKAAYATDTLTVEGAVDVQNYQKNFDADVAVKVAVKPVTVDAYYATNVKATAYRYFFNSTKNIASVRVAVALDPVTVTVYGENLVNEDRILAVKEEGKFGALSEDAQFGIMPSLGEKEEIIGLLFKGFWFANAGVGYDVMENLSVDAHFGYERLYGFLGDEKGHVSGLAIQAGAEYKLEKVTITADAYVGKMFVKAYDDSYASDLHFAVVVGAESDSLVENAVLSATLNIDKFGVVGLYNSTRAVDEYSKSANFGFKYDEMSFTVGCKVTF